MATGHLDPPLPHQPARRLTLRPGLRVVRRDERHLQIGIDPPLRVVVPDEPAVRRLLEELRLARPVAPSTPVAHRTLAALLERDLVVDADELAARFTTATDRAAVAAAYAAHGDDAARRLDARAASTVLVDAPPDLGRVAERMLVTAGVRTTTREDEGTVLLVVDDGVVPRDRLDDAVRRGVPHLLVSGGPDAVTVGPFVVPGLTACVRCVDASRAEADPRRSMLLEQCRTPPAGSPPRDPALMALAVAWAVRDVLSFVEGQEPATWSASVTVGSDLCLPRRRFHRHPHCGCSWGEVLAG